MKVEGLRLAVAQLPAREFDEISRWLEELLAAQWDQQIEADIQAGRLDEAGRRADEDFEAGRYTPLSSKSTSPRRASGITTANSRRLLATSPSAASPSWRPTRVTRRST